jgi:hypothetical protein
VRPGSFDRHRLGREVGAISIARTSRYFSRDASAMVRGVARVEDAMMVDPQSQLLADKLRRAVRSTNATKT